MDQASRLLHALSGVYRAGTYPIDVRWQSACDPALPQIADYLRVHIKRFDHTLELLRGLELPAGARQVVDLGTWHPYHAIVRETVAPLDFLYVDDGHDLDLESDPLPFADGSTAVVLLLEVIEHFYQDPMFALREIHRILQPGGRLVISTPNLASFRGVVAILSHGTPMTYGKYTPGNPPHVHEYVPRELRILLDAAGFEPLVWTANVYNSDTPSVITDWLRSNGFSPYEREDTIFAIATKRTAPRDRYPAELYDAVPPTRRLTRSFKSIGTTGVEETAKVGPPVTVPASPPRRTLNEGPATIEALCDGAYYRLRARLDEGEDPIAHYLTRGADDGHDPHPLFSTSYYLTSNADVAQAGMNPLEHYLRFGGSERRPFHPLFDTTYYLAEVARHGQQVRNPLLHFLRVGVHQRWSPHPLIDLNYILENTPELLGSDRNPLLHCLATGAAPHPLFDPTHYAKQRPGASDPLADFIASGSREGLSPHPLFDPFYYLDTNLDVAEGGVDPFFHYLHYGAAEQRAPHPLIDPAYYVRQCDGDSAAQQNALIHFVIVGARRGVNPHPLFDVQYYETQLARLGITTDNALIHFLTEEPLCDPHSTFSVRAYREKTAVDAGMNPLVHFVLQDERRRRVDC
jgi:SAM-dependent methyltransferase